MKQRVNLYKTALSAIGLNLFQLVVLTGLLVYSIFMAKTTDSAIPVSENLIFILLALGASVNIYISIKNRYLLKIDEQRNRMLEEAVSRLEKLNNTLRAQRHDFLNHLQVVYGLMEMEEFAEAINYIDKVYNDIQRVSRALKTSSPAINALLQAKILDCEKRGIEMTIIVASGLEALKIPSWEFCRVMGNLLDNAAAALEDSQEVKKLTVELTEDASCHILKVRDNGRKIPADLVNKIFEPGFTTKGEKGEGMGLSIVKEIITAYGGTIKVDSSDTFTEFTGFVPKN